jgi:hypothetical protein
MKNAQMIATLNAMKAEMDAMKADLVQTKAELAKSKAARADRKPSDFKILVVTEIPSTKGKKGKWSSVEITDTATGKVTKCFLDHTYDAGKREDGANQTVIYATRMDPTSESAPAPAKDAPARDEDIAFGQE